MISCHRQMLKNTLCKRLWASLGLLGLYRTLTDQAQPFVQATISPLCLVVMKRLDDETTLSGKVLGPLTLPAVLNIKESVEDRSQWRDQKFNLRMSIMNTNQTLFKDFIILPLTDQPNLKGVLFCAILLIYLLTLFGNVAIISVSKLDTSLHMPMYYFLGNLSFLDICYTSTTMPKMLQLLLAEKGSITFLGCIVQMYIFIALVGTECVLLAVMSYDRFLAICIPLRYSSYMTHKNCIALAAVSWVSGLLNSVVHTVFTFRLQFCESNKINYFYCDIPPILSIACESTSVNEKLLLSIGVFIGWTPFFCIIVSYIYIIVTIIKMTSTEGRQKAFSTCGSHLTVVVIFFGSVIFSYVRPISTYSMTKDRLISVLYSVVSPMLNPIIYTLKNQDVKNAFGRQFIRMLGFS
ncbi:PREDICTED: olfactory receptor 5V1-like [Nanorana parkeri]|uniref:olfactory receptor 5V1-like n=1 Tax=Nanorana parkeri TaxID=125878 RepID=UPI0008549841|nr:PREDICTED: olfactory receptor 5V1-like [Nanorana parkeri]